MNPRLFARPIVAAALVAVLVVLTDGGRRLLMQTDRIGWPSTEDAREIQSLIHDLRKIADPLPGLSPSMSGYGFAPLPFAAHMRNGILMNHGLTRSAAFTRLVEIGPKALPQLLAALDDPTETEMTIEHSGPFGMMHFADPPAIRWAGERSTPQRFREFNPERLIEHELLEEGRRKSVGRPGKDPFAGALDKYRVTVGNVCYVIIGQIVNRTYLAVQYQPTACVYVTSPVHDADVKTFVRRAWASDNPAATLFDSLSLDFRTVGEFDAGVRLAFYFPAESRPIFLTYLEGIDVNVVRTSGIDRDVRSVRAMAVSSDEVVRQRIIEIMETTPDPLLFANALHAVPKKNADSVFRQAKEFLAEVRASAPKRPDFVYDIFLNICEAFPDDCEALFSEIVKTANEHEGVELCRALGHADAAAPVGKILAPFLIDDRMLLQDYAAEAIARHDKSLTFDPKGSESERKQQFERIWRHCTGIGVRSGP
jgi:hypothetical protein